MRIPVLLAWLLLAACGSSPETRFYSLEPRPGGGEPLSLEGLPVAVASVELPLELDRPSLVYRKGKNRFEVLGTHRWVGPLDLMVRRTLAAGLAERLGEQSVVMPGEPKPRDGMRQIVVVVHEFAFGPERQVSLAARWTLLDAEQRSRLTRVERIRTPVDSDQPKAVVAGMSEALGVLADRIAVGLAGTAPEQAAAGLR